MQKHTQPNTNIRGPAANGCTVKPWWPWLRPLWRIPSPPDSAHCPRDTACWSLRDYRDSLKSPRKTAARCLVAADSLSWWSVLHVSVCLCLRHEGSVCCFEIRMQRNHTLSLSVVKIGTVYRHLTGETHTEQPKNVLWNSTAAFCRMIKMNVSLSDYSYREQTRFRALGLSRRGAREHTITCSAAPWLTLVISTHCPQDATVQGS